MATISISQLDTATQAKVDDLYEVAVVDENSQTGYASRNLTAAQIATLFAQVVQFSGLSTEAKTIIAAINEAAQNGGTEVEANPAGTPTDTLETIGIDGTIYEVGGSSEPVSKTATGNPIHIEDAADAPIVSGEVTFEPKQDLHGYDKPWAGGVGKNSLMPLSSDKTVAGISVHQNSDGSLTLNGTAESNLIIITSTFKVIANTDYAISIGNYDDSVISDFGLKGFSNNKVINNNVNFMSDGIQILTSVGTVFNNVIVWPQIEFGTQATSFEPYSNICPIEGYTDCEVEVTGKNLFDVLITDLSFSNNSGGSYSKNDGILTVTATTTVYSGSYSIIQGNHMNNAIGILSYSVDVKANVSTNISIGGTNRGRKQVSVGPEWQRITFENINFSDSGMVFVVYGTGTACQIQVKNFQIEKGSTATPFEPYQSTTYTIDLDGTRYGGTVDLVSGVMTVTHKYLEFDGSSDEEWSYGSSRASINALSGIKGESNTRLEVMCNIGHYESSSTATFPGVVFGYASGNLYYYPTEDITSTSDWRAYLANHTMQICYELATPFTVQLTPEQIRTMEGTNNISTNMTNMSLEYITQDYQPLVELIERGAGHHYSEQERVVGTWIDGKPLYEKVVDFGTLPNSTSKSVAHSISNLDAVCFVDAIANNGASAYIPIPFVSKSGLQYQLALTITSTDIVINTGDNFTNYSAFVTLQYTKTTD